MSNNLMDTVAQAVNSLVSAFKLPDESAKANDMLGSMNFPQFSRVLPYKDYDSATGLFINTKTVGFMFEARPLPGANAHIVASLENLLRTKLPRGVPVTINLISSKLVGDDIEYGLREFSWSGKQAEKFNAITRAYYLQAAEKQFSLPPGMDLPLTLRNYRVFISCCVPRKKHSKAQIVELENQIKIIRAQGSMYPFSGWVSNESSPLQSSLLLNERMAYKLHRQGQILETVGADVAVCYEYPSPIIPKERWRYQMVNMYPDSAQCHPLGRTVTRWEVGKNPPVTRKNFGYLMWRKRNCVY